MDVSLVVKRWIRHAEPVLTETLCVSDPELLICLTRASCGAGGLSPLTSTRRQHDRDTEPHPD
jgi:hypothetical protein